MAAVLANLLRSRISAASSKRLLPAILPHQAPSPAASPAASMRRLMHTGQWRNSMLLRGDGSKLTYQKPSLVMTREFHSEEHRTRWIMRLFTRKRFMGDVDSGPDYLTVFVAGVYLPVTFVLMLPFYLRRWSRYIEARRSNCGSPSDECKLIDPLSVSA